MEAFFYYLNYFLIIRCGLSLYVLIMFFRLQQSAFSRETLTPLFTDIFTHFEKKKPAVLPSICSLKLFSACTYTYVSIILKEVALPQERQESKSWILDSALWIPDSRYLVPDFLSVKLEFHIPVVSGVSGFLELELEIPTPRFWIPQK